MVENTNSRARLPFALVHQHTLAILTLSLSEKEGLLRKFKELLYVKHLEYCLSHGKNINYYRYQNMLESCPQEGKSTD